MIDFVKLVVAQTQNQKRSNKMNATAKLIEEFKQKNKEEEHRQMKQKILTEIDNTIKLHQFNKNITFTKEQKKEAKIRLSEWLFCQAKHLFNPLLSAVIKEIINEAKG